MTDPNAEKRATPRKFFRTHANAQYEGNAFKVVTLDVSLGGMAIVSAYNLVVGKTIDLEFKVPVVSATGLLVPVIVKATIMHSMFSAAADGFKIGLKFNGLDESSVNALTQYIG